MIFDVSVSNLLGETVELKDTKTELAEISQKLENLNAMMAERNSRSRRIMLIAAAVTLIFVALIIIFYTAVLIIAGIRTSHSIGIIGGADGPTSILIASTGLEWLEIIISFIVSFSVIAVSVYLFKKAKR